jgi:hypothetical protein
MNIPGFTAEASIYKTGGHYSGSVGVIDSRPGVVPAIPPCRNCNHICDVCAETGMACGGCALCNAGYCDPRPPGGLRPPRPRPFEDFPFTL